MALCPDGVMVEPVGQVWEDGGGVDLRSGARGVRHLRTHMHVQPLLPLPCSSHAVTAVLLSTIVAEACMRAQIRQERRQVEGLRFEAGFHQQV